jgi:hypothetical protein
MFGLEIIVFFLICPAERGVLFYSSIPAAILYSQKSSTDCKVAGGIRELHAAPIMFCNAAGRAKINIKKDRLGLKFCVPAAVLLLIKAYYPTIPLSGRSNLVRRYL